MSMTTVTSPPPMQTMKRKQGQSCRWVLSLPSSPACHKGCTKVTQRLHKGTPEHLCTVHTLGSSNRYIVCLADGCCSVYQPDRTVSAPVVLIHQTDVAAQSDEMPDRADGKDHKMAVKAAAQEANGEADMEVGMDGDVASVQTKPAEAEHALPTNKQAEQMSPVKPNPKERLAGESSPYRCKDSLSAMAALSSKWAVTCFCQHLPNTAHSAAVHGACTCKPCLVSSSQLAAHMHKYIGHPPRLQERSCSSFC